MFSYFSLKFSHYIVLEAKCVGNWKSETHWWAHNLVRETKLQNFAFIGPAYWIWEPPRLLISRIARLFTIRGGPNIFAQLSAEKQYVGGGGDCVLHLPPIAIKGAQAWDIRERVIHTERSHLGRWLEDWTKKPICVKCKADIRHFVSLLMTEYAVKIIPRLLSMW